MELDEVKRAIVWKPPIAVPALPIGRRTSLEPGSYVLYNSGLIHIGNETRIRKFGDDYLAYEETGRGCEFNDCGGFKEGVGKRRGRDGREYALLKCNKCDRYSRSRNMI